MLQKGCVNNQFLSKKFQSDKKGEKNLLGYTEAFNLGDFDAPGGNSTSCSNGKSYFLITGFSGSFHVH